MFGRTLKAVIGSACNVAVLMLSVLLVGCSTQHPPEGYRVVGFDNATKQWTILRNGTFDGEYRVKRLIAVCDFYKSGTHEPVSGPDACNLQVGRLIVPNMLAKDRKKFLDVYEMSTDRISITEGDGDDRIMQQFTVMKYDLLSPK
jgi:hypothetical protein